MAEEGDADLAAFFAKKKGKDKKKKKAVNLDELGQQLERKARLQELEEAGETKGEEDFFPAVNAAAGKADSEERKVKQPPPIAQDDADWLDYKAATVEFAFKEYQEMADGEPEQENKQHTYEPIKTWNTGNNIAPEATEAEEKVPVATKSSVYQPPGQARRATATAPLDIASQEMFPSIANAEELEKKEKERVKEAEEKRKPVQSMNEPSGEPTKTKWTHVEIELPTQQQLLEPLVKTDRYEPPRAGHRGAQDGRPGSGLGKSRPPDTESVASNEMNWRSELKASVPKPPSQRASSPAVARVPNRPAEASREDSMAAADTKWRSGKPAAPQRASSPAPQPTAAEADKASSMRSWRQEAKPAPQQVPQPVPAAPAEPPAPGRYVPPALRKDGGI